MPLHPDTVREMLGRIPLEEGLFVAGGQALNFWAEHYSSCKLSAYRPYVSKHFDLFGRYDVGARLPKAIHVDVAWLPTWARRNFLIDCAWRHSKEWFTLKWWRLAIAIKLDAARSRM